MDLPSFAWWLGKRPADTADEPETSNASNETASNLAKITVRQLHEDISAYGSDFAYCQSQLSQPDLTPQERRTLRLRTLDLEHQVRHCKHRIELEEFHRRNSNSASKRPASTDTYHVPPKRNKFTPINATSTYFGTPKREQAPTPDEDAEPAAREQQIGTTTYQRLGFWDCRMCKSHKYRYAGPNRTPAESCKCPLKDIGKLMSHCLQMHREHTLEERCRELGDALQSNIRPFEYWVCRTKHWEIGDGSQIKECVVELQDGKVPGLLRALHHDGAAFPS